MLKKVFISTLIITFFITSLSFYTVYAEINLVKNSGFEEASGNSIKSWISGSYKGQEAAEFIIDENAYQGSKCAAIINKKADDSKLSQDISIAPGKTYLVRCYIRTEGIEQKAGSANITLMQGRAIYTSEEYDNTGGEWKKLEFQITSLEDYGAVFKLILRLGGQGTLNSGKAFFDHVSVIRLEEQAKGVADAKFYIPGNSRQSAVAVSNSGHKTGVSSSASGRNTFLIIGGLAVLAAIIAVEVILLKRKKAGENEGPEKGEGL